MSAPDAKGSDKNVPGMSVEDWRRKIDEIDRRLVQLLNERSRCVVEIGHIKQASGDALYQPDREKQVLDGVVSANPGPLPDAAIRRLFERILDEARSVERVVMHGGDGKKETSS
jgi:chorismate mutase-like protein